MKKKILGIIPARGGSKGVKRKNVRDVGGKPLICWSIEAAKNANVFDYFCVTTDDTEIEEVARTCNAEVVKRPKSLAQDKTPMIPVLQHVCEQTELRYGKFDIIVLLQPTAPMRKGYDIKNALELFNSSNEVRSLVSVYQVEDCHPSRMYKLHETKLKSLYEEPIGNLRQDLEPIYHRNGAVYICERDLLMKNNTLTCNEPLAYIMPKERSANIDDEQDLVIADLLMK